MHITIDLCRKTKYQHIIMISFKEAVATCLTKKYKTISGRATRAEFWWFTLFMYIIFVAIYALMLLMAAYVRQEIDYSPLIGCIPCDYVWYNGYSVYTVDSAFDMCYCAAVA